MIVVPVEKEGYKDYPWLLSFVNCHAAQVVASGICARCYISSQVKL